MINETLKDICIDARECRDSSKPLQEQHHCKEVSLAICYKAAEAGIITSLCSGTFLDQDGQPQDHYWVRHEHIIYDATADQFDPHLGRLHIDEELYATQYKENYCLIFNPMVFNIIKNMK